MIDHYDEKILNHAYFQCVEKMSQVAVITDKNFNIIYANKAFSDVTGYSLDEAKGHNANILKSNTHSAMFYDNLRMTVMAGMTWYGTFKNKRKDGSLYWEDAAIFPIDVEGEPLYVKTAVDVSNRQRMASEKQKDTLLASMIQKSLLPENLFDNEIVIKSYYRPYENVSGDIFHWQQLDEHRYCVFLADVIGHGVGSALMTTAIVALVTNLINHNPDPGVLLKSLNNRIMDLFKSKDLSQINYFTSAYVVVDTEKKEINFSNCGHPKIYLKKGDVLEVLQDINFPVGLFADVDFSYGTYTYTDDVELLLYTDGLIEKDFGKLDEVSVLEALLSEHEVKFGNSQLMTEIVEQLVLSKASHIKDDITLISIGLKAGV